MSYEYSDKKDGIWYMLLLICGSLLAAAAAYALYFRADMLSPDERITWMVYGLLVSMLCFSLGFYLFLRRGNGRLASTFQVVLFYTVIILTSRMIGITL